MPKKTERGDPLVSPGNVWYAEKEEKLFWFSSLGQMIQFGTIKFCITLRTILVSSCGLKKKSHYNSRVSLHEAPTKNRICTLDEVKNQTNRTMPKNPVKGGSFGIVYTFEQRERILDAL